MLCHLEDPLLVVPVEKHMGKGLVRTLKELLQVLQSCSVQCLAVIAALLYLIKVIDDFLPFLQSINFPRVSNDKVNDQLKEVLIYSNKVGNVFHCFIELINFPGNLSLNSKYKSCKVKQCCQVLLGNKVLAMFLLAKSLQDHMIEVLV